MNHHRFRELGRGVYTLIIKIDSNVTIQVGSLGSTPFRKGLYAYTGSALGRGSSPISSRIRRHLKRGKNVFWHIDHLTNHPSATVLAAVASTTEARMECLVNKGVLKKTGVQLHLRFGASDCRSGCGTHLVYLGLCSLQRAEDIVTSAPRLCGLSPHLSRF